jgi:hypothetical protein
MLQVVISESAVLFELERGRVRDLLWRLPDVRFAAVDLLLEREFTSDERDQFFSAGLINLSLSDEEIAACQHYEGNERRLSLTDVASLVVARQRSHALLVTHGPLRLRAKLDEIRVVDCLWVLDLLHDHGLASRSSLHASLTMIESYPRCRIPAAEVRARLSRWMSLREAHHASGNA